jgi:hypothetical protein
LTLIPASAVANNQDEDPLPSWSTGATKQSILTFVEQTVTEGSPSYIPPAERIAVFDNDGTLWCEQPMYVQLAFAIDRVKTLAPQHPEWSDQEPFKAILAGDIEAALAGGEKAIAQVIAATHAGMTVDEFEKIVSDWIATAKHPTRDRLYTELAYQPMIELLAFLRANGFKTYIVSGGGVGFMRPWTERVYGVPPEQVVGSRGKYQFELTGDETKLVKLPEIDLVDDGPGKPVGIQQVIGRRPIMAVGNSDGDLEMLQWTTIGEQRRLGLIIHHTDAEREYAYDRDSHIGKLAKALDEAPMRGWTVVDMKTDWRVIFPEN